MAQDSSSPTTGSSALQVFIYWAIVAVPLGWGVYKTVQKSIPLFSPVAASAPATATPAPMAATPPALATDPTVVAPLAPAPDALPFSTAEPSATVAPINPPASPAN